MTGGIELNIRRVVLDVDKAFKVPTLVEIGATIDTSPGVRGPEGR